MKKKISISGRGKNYDEFEIFGKNNFFKPLEKYKFKLLREILIDIQRANFDNLKDHAIIVHQDDYDDFRTNIDKIQGYDLHNLRSALTVLMYDKDRYVSARRMSILGAYLSLTENYVTFESLCRSDPSYEYEMNLKISKGYGDDKSVIKEDTRIILY